MKIAALRTPASFISTAVAVIALCSTFLVFAAPATPVQAATAGPSITTVRPSRNALAVRWASVTGATSYQVRWGTNAKLKGAKTKVVSGSYTELRHLASHRGYWIRVRAILADGSRTSYGRTTRVWTMPRSGYRLLPPAGVTAKPVGSTSLRVTFKPRSHASTYLVKYGTSSSAMIEHAFSRSTTLILPGLRSSKMSLFEVLALNSKGKPISNYSMLARATTGPAYRSSLHYTAGSHDPVRVASYNVLSYATSGRPSWESRRGYVVSTIAKQAPDVIGIQEVSQGTMRNSTLTQYDDLVARLGDPYRLTNAARYNCKVTTSRSNCTYRNQGASQANRIIYNANTLVLLAQGSMRLERLTSKDNERYLAWAKFRQITTGKVFLFATTHLQSNQGSSTTVYNKTYHYLRVRQAKAISAELNRVGGSLPKMLTGDMNTRWNSPGPNGTYTNPQYDIFTSSSGANLRDPLRSGITGQRYRAPETGLSTIDARYNSFNGYARTQEATTTSLVGTNIDYIYLSKTIDALRWQTVLNLNSSGRIADSVIPSDHNMIRVDVVLP